MPLRYLSYATRSSKLARPQGWWWWLIPLIIFTTAFALWLVGLLTLMRQS